MARVTGPLHSDSASGTFANSLTFATWKGRAYARQRVTPANPRSPAQLGVRAMMKYLAQLWASVDAANKATWAGLAAAGNFSNFNAFVRANLQRWQQNEAPTQAYPALEEHVTLAVTSNVATPADGYVDVAITIPGSATADDTTAVALLRDAAAITAFSWAKVIAILPAAYSTTVNYTDSPLPAGTYHYRAAPISDDGVLGTMAADDEAIVT